MLLNYLNEFGHMYVIHRFMCQGGFCPICIVVKQNSVLPGETKKESRPLDKPGKEDHRKMQMTLRCERFQLNKA